MSMNIIGISAYYHNSACCLMRDGVLVCAAEEERFSRLKHDPGLPVQSFRFCLEQGGITISDVDRIAFYETPLKKLSRQLWMSFQTDSPDFSRGILMASLASVRRVEREFRTLLGYEGHIEFVEHHEAHAASSFYFSGFPEAAILTADGVGEWATTTYGRAEGTSLELFEEVHFPDSIGLLYSTITAYLGFEVNDGEYKVMGLAPYGTPRFVDHIYSMIAVLEEGAFRLNMDYFDFLRADRMYSERLVELFGRPPREKDTELLDFHKDVACSLQVVLEDILLEKARYLYQHVPSEHLCMAGGVALNCVANSRVLKEGPFSRVFVQPAAYDGGGALGAAAIAHIRLSGTCPEQKQLEQVFLGPEFSSDDISTLLQATSATSLDFRGKTEQLLEFTAERLAESKVVGWFSGRMEFGPRALGARSIIADPRVPDMRDRINALVKKREGFRPFAPAVLADKAHEHFDIDHPSPFMLETCQVRSELPLSAITHVNGSARIQTVHAHTNPRFATLLKCFEKRTGCPILLNTSFNMRGEPIVCTPVDAILCFVRSEIDLLVLEDFVIEKERIPASWKALSAAISPVRQAINQNVYTLI